MTVIITLSPRDYDAVLFDLNGVLTRTANVHASDWKKLFDSFLKQRATQAGEPFGPFDINADYLRYVDGKPRYGGVRDFLTSRGIDDRDVNAGAKLYRKFNNKHLEPPAGRVAGEDGVFLQVRTCQSHIQVSQVARWEDISRRMFVPFHGVGIINQFEGYDSLRELDWQHYRARYGNIQ